MDNVESRTDDDRRSSERPGYVGYGVRPLPLLLREAVEIVRNVTEVAGEKGPWDGLAKVMGYSSKSSNFRFKVGALRKFGLVTTDSTGYELTAVGRSIARPHSPDDATRAIQEAFLSVSGLKKIWEHYLDQTLPQKDFIANRIGTLLGVPSEVTAEWADFFLDCADFAGLVDRSPSGSLRARSLFKPAPKDVPLLKPDVDGEDFRPPRDQPGKGGGQPGGMEALFGGLTGGVTFRKKISGDRVALFFIPEDLSQGDVDAITSILKSIQAALEGLKAADPE